MKVDELCNLKGLDEKKTSLWGKWESDFFQYSIRKRKKITQEPYNWYFFNKVILTNNFKLYSKILIEKIYII